MSISDSDTVPILQDLESTCNDYSTYAAINTTKIVSTNGIIYK